VPLFVSHLILILLSATAWILCASLLDADFPTHISAWVYFELGLSVAESAFGVWAAIIDSRDTTFYERSAHSFLVVDGVLLVVQSAVSVTGAVYWRQGSAEKKVVFDCVVILSWLIFVTLGMMSAQDKVKLGND